MKQNNNTSPREDLEAKKWQQVQSTDQESQIQNDLCTPVARSSQLRTRAVLKKVLFFFFFNFACLASSLQPVDSL